VSREELNRSILAKCAAGTLTVEQVSAELAALEPAKTGKAAPRITARKTESGGLWMSLGFKAVPGCANSISSSIKGWHAIVGLVKDGTIEAILTEFAAGRVMTKAEAAIARAKTELAAAQV
jgi:hypothetical protein